MALIGVRMNSAGKMLATLSAPVCRDLLTADGDRRSDRRSSRTSKGFQVGKETETETVNEL